MNTLFASSDPVRCTTGSRPLWPLKDTRERRCLEGKGY